MKKHRISIYIGAEGISLSQVKNKGEVESIYLSFSDLEKNSAIENGVNGNVKLEALIQKGIRELGAEDVDVILGMPDKDMIFRSLDLPLMNDEEIYLALPFEIEKYIPFKIDTLYWTYKYNRNTETKKCEVAFVGIKKQTLDDFKEVVEKIGLKVVGAEGGSFALIDSFFKKDKISKKTKSFAVLIITDQELEAIIYNKTSPHFSRYVKTPVDSKGEIDYRKIIEDLKVTFNYYKREFYQSGIDKVYIVTKKSVIDHFTEYINDFEVPHEMIVVEELYESSQLYNISQVKSIALASRSTLPSISNFDLLKKRKVKKKLLDIIPIKKLIESKEIPINLRLLGSVFCVGLLIFAAFLAVNIMRMQKESMDLITVEEDYDRFINSVELKFDKYKQLSSKDLEKRKDALKKSLKDIQSVAVPVKNTKGLIDFMVANLTEGLWFESMLLTRRDDFTGIEVKVNGFVFLGDESKERGSLDNYLLLLQESSYIKNNGFTVFLNSVKKSTYNGYMVTEFLLTVSRI